MSINAIKSTNNISFSSNSKINNEDNKKLSLANLEEKIEQTDVFEKLATNIIPGYAFNKNGHKAKGAAFLLGTVGSLITSFFINSSIKSNLKNGIKPKALKNFFGHMMPAFAPALLISSIIAGIVLPAKNSQNLIKENTSQGGQQAQKIQDEPAPVETTIQQVEEKPQETGSIDAASQQIKDKTEQTQPAV